MNSYPDNCYVVFVQELRKGQSPNERKLVECGSYHEAEMVRRENAAPGRRCIIRYLGLAGGGD
jgi:hypothetical protein